ncbi:MAG: DUF5946 family protein [Anaerolineales bacterium]
MPEQVAVCPGCGAKIKTNNNNLDKDFNASAACRELVFQLSYFTLSLGDQDFIHQLVVDSYAAQHSGENTKPVTLTFALVGLYLVNELRYTGSGVQQVHMALAKKSKTWPSFNSPKGENWLTVQDVIQSPDNEKQEMIKKWSQSVWGPWKPEKEKIASLLKRHLDF